MFKKYVYTKITTKRIKGKDTMYMSDKTIIKLLDKHIAFIFTDLIDNKVITNYTVSNDPCMKYLYYFKITPNYNFYDSTILCNSTNFYTIHGNVLEIYRFGYQTQEYKFEDIKNEDDIRRISEIFKQDILKEIDYKRSSSLNNLISDLTKLIPKILSVESEAKEFFIKEIKDNSIKLVNVINENLLSSIPNEDDLLSDESSSFKKKAKLFLVI